VSRGVSLCAMYQGTRAWLLARMNAGVFAVCEHCGDSIDAKRLKVVPYATRCGSCEPA